jgi:serine/threonine protein kinase/F0F1-type ATP synthase delta subunit
MTMPEDLAASADSDALPGITAGVNPASPLGYELLDEIGHGGMGVVYRARDTALDRDVAVKLLAERYPADSLAAQRFLSEARITGQLQHPGIPAVHQVGALADGRPFLAMKLIKGNTLEDILKHRPDPAADRGRLLAIFEAVCQAVGYAHAHRVIHRDLKPANVMVGAFGEVQVMDWGLAKSLASRERERTDSDPQETLAWTQLGPTPETGSQTQAGSMVGTPAFIPPEQAIGEIERVTERSDVFGLGALLAVILTGQPPYVGETGESVRVQAVRGKLVDCFARLDASGAEPELVALCKNCLAFESEDRPANAGAVAAAVAGLRAAADERARRAELERVRVEGEQAMALARAAERRKRRRLVIGSAAVLALAAVGGLTAVLAVQRQANVQLAAKNAELAEQQLEVEARFETAQKAIATFHTGVSEDFLLKNAEFRDLQSKLLNQAAGFYADLERLLAGKTDAKSHKLLAGGYFKLGELTAKIGDQKEALAMQRKALALRRGLAAAPGADVETRLDVARSLRAVALVLWSTGDGAGTLSAFDEMRDLAVALEAESPTDAVRVQLADAHIGIGQVLWTMKESAEALKEYRKALAAQQQLAETNPAAIEYKRALALSHNYIGHALLEAGKPGETLKEFQEAVEILQRLADANPTVPEFQSDLAQSQTDVCWVLSKTGKPTEALQECQKALAIRRRLAAAYPAVQGFQNEIAKIQVGLGDILRDARKLTDALKEYQLALSIMQKLTEANPTIPEYRSDMARNCYRIGRVLTRQGRMEDAFLYLDKGQALFQQLVEAHPGNDHYKLYMGYSHIYRGAAHLRAGHPAEAAADLRRALDLHARNKTPDLEDHFHRSHALAMLAALATDGNSGVTAAEAAGFADRAVATLRDAIQAGWGNVAELKESDFDAIRGREDFKKLLAELEAKAEKPPATAPPPGEKK